jgi:sortase A
VAKSAEYLCWILGLACLGYVAFSYGRAGIFQAYESWRFDRDLQKQPPSRSRLTVTPTGSLAATLPSDDSVLGRLEIPRLGLSVMVLQGDDEATFAKGAGHLPKTPLPGQAGNVVFAAHRDTFFRPLRLIRKGDEISVTTRQGIYRYHVEMIAEVSPDDVEVLGARHHPTLTLITCYPFVFVGNAPKRFVVRAAEIDAPQQGDSPVVASVATTVDDTPKSVSTAHASRPRRKHHATLLHSAPTSHSDVPGTSPASAPVTDVPEGAPQPAASAPDNASPSAPTPAAAAFAAGPAVSATPESARQKAGAQQPDPSKHEPSKPRRLLRKVRGWLSPRSQGSGPD